MASQAVCRNCGGDLAVPWWSTDRRRPVWVHVEERTGLLGSEFCYYSPRADPILE